MDLLSLSCRQRKGNSDDAGWGRFETKTPYLNPPLKRKRRGKTPLQRNHSRLFSADPQGWGDWQCQLHFLSKAVVVSWSKSWCFKGLSWISGWEFREWYESMNEILVVEWQWFQPHVKYQESRILEWICHVGISRKGQTWYLPYHPCIVYFPTFGLFCW